MAFINIHSRYDLMIHSFIFYLWPHFSIHGSFLIHDLLRFMSSFRNSWSHFRFMTSFSRFIHGLSFRFMTSFSIHGRISLHLSAGVYIYATTEMKHYWIIKFNVFEGHSLKSRNDKRCVKIVARFGHQINAVSRPGLDIRRPTAKGFTRIRVVI